MIIAEVANIYNITVHPDLSSDHKPVSFELGAVNTQGTTNYIPRRDYTKVD